MFSVGSLFAGIGGFDLGFERVGWYTEWFVENDPYCQRVLAKNWPGIDVYGDIRETFDLPYVDVLCGGFPCQDISVAGKREGIDGTRSSLWGEFARIIGEIRPQYIIVENVAALRTRGLDRVLADLCALGYDAEWSCIRASAFGAPHARDRFWLVAYPNSEQVWQQSFPDVKAPTPLSEFNGVEWFVADSTGVGRGEGEQGAEVSRTGWRDEVTASGEVVSDPISVGLTGGPRVFEQRRWAESEDFRKDLGRIWEFEPSVGRVVTRLPSRMDRLKCLGNSLVPQIATWIAQGIVEYEKAK